MYNSDGSVAVSEFRLNTTLTQNQELPAITALGNGGFAASWESYKQDGSYDSIAGRVFDASGDAVNESDFLINTKTSGQQYYPSMTTLADGKFVVTWFDEGNGSDIRAQLFNADGSTFGENFLVNPNDTYGSQYWPTVAALADGGFTITWYSNYFVSHNDHNYDIVARQFDSSGNAVSNATLTGGIADDKIALADGQIGVKVDLGDGDDSLTLGDTRDALSVANVETISLGGGDDSLTLTGSTGAEVSSGSGDDMIYGGDGSDIISGDEGDDTLFGGAGMDLSLIHISEPTRPY